VLLDESVRAVMSGRGSNSPTPPRTGEDDQRRVPRGGRSDQEPRRRAISI